MQIHRLVALSILTFFPAFAIAADIAPPAQSPQSENRPAPRITPEKPSESGVPAIQHTPERGADPRGSVTPPNRDPDMSMNPDVAPSPREGINPPDGPKPQRKRGAHE